MSGGWIFGLFFPLHISHECFWEEILQQLLDGLAWNLVHSDTPPDYLWHQRVPSACDDTHAAVGSLVSHADRVMRSMTLRIPENKERGMKKKQVLEHSEAHILAILFFTFSDSLCSPFSFCSYGDRVEHFRVLEGGGQYSIWDKSFCSLNRLVDFYRAHSIAMEKVVCLRDAPSSLHLHSDPGRNPYPSPYKSSSQESIPTARLHSHAERESAPRLLKPVLEVWQIIEHPFSVSNSLYFCLMHLSVWRYGLSPSVCRNLVWLMPSATTLLLKPPTSTSGVVTSSSCWTVRAPWPGADAVEAESASSQQNMSNHCTINTLSGLLSCYRIADISLSGCSDLPYSFSDFHAKRTKI